MSEGRIVVPEGITGRVFLMLRKLNDYPHPDSKECGKLLVVAVAVCEEFARALIESPITPTRSQLDAMYDSMKTVGDAAEYMAVEWQRRMFLAPEPEIPEDVKDLLRGTLPNGGYCVSEEVGKLVIEAYRRGQKAPK